MRMRLIAGAAIPALALGASLVPGTALAHTVIYQAHATGVQGTVKVGDITKKVLLVDNGMSCKQVEEEETASFVQTPKPIFVKANTITTYTLGANNQTDAYSYLEKLVVEVPGVTVTADLIGSYSQAVCNTSTMRESASGGADFVNVRVNGNPIQINGSPNQRIAIDDIASVTFDERTVWRSEYKSNALHIRLFNEQDSVYGDVIIGYSRAKVTCDFDGA